MRLFKGRVKPRAGDRCVHRVFIEVRHEEIKMAVKSKYSIVQALMMLFCQSQYMCTFTRGIPTMGNAVA